MTKQRKQPNLETTRDYSLEVEQEAQDKIVEHSEVKALIEGRDERSKQENLLEEILSPKNMNKSYLKVVMNKGSSGIDKMEIDSLLEHLKAHGKELIEQILGGRYKPQAVKRVKIPKPEGGERNLGIPTVVDRMIQQAISQILTPIFEKGFSEYSYGFRPNRNAHQAINKAKEYIDEGNRYVVDIDLEKFFDRVNHDKLMNLLSKQIVDKRVLKLIRQYLSSGIMEGGVFRETEEGTPQGGPLSPLMSNIILNELDKELEKRGHKFCRYADDCNIYVKSQKSADRVLKSVSKYLEKELKLKVNEKKSASGNPKERKFLGFSFYSKRGETGIRVHDKSLERLKAKIKQITNRSNGFSMSTRIRKLNALIVGWICYFRLADIKGQCQRIDEWMRRRLRMCYWKNWKKIRTKKENLLRLGIPKAKAWEYANSRKSYWRIAGSFILTTSLTNKHFKEQELLSFSQVYANTQ